MILNMALSSKTKLSLSALLALWFCPFHIYADDSVHYYLKPINSIQSVNNSLSVSFELPCAGKFHGFILTPRQDIGTNKFEIAAVVASKNLMCAKISRDEKKSLDFLKLTPDQLIIDPAIKRVQFNAKYFDFVNPYEVRPTTQKIQMIYESRGGKYAGALIRENESHEVLMGVYEVYDKAPLIGQKPPSLSAPKVVNFPDIIKSDARKVVAFENEASEKIKEYRLKLAPIKRGSLKENPEGNLEVTYLRACNEAPIGITLWNDKDRTKMKLVSLNSKLKKKDIRLGVLVAQYYNYKCKSEDKIAPRTSPKTYGEWTVLKNEDLKFLLKDYRVKLVRQSNSEKPRLRLKSPIQYAMLVNEQKKMEGLRVDAIGGCGQELGIVYSRDFRGNLTMGILERTPIFQCKISAKKVSLFQPVVLGEPQDQLIYPMKLVGLN